MFKKIIDKFLGDDPRINGENLKTFLQNNPDCQPKGCPVILVGSSHVHDSWVHKLATEKANDDDWTHIKAVNDV